MSQTLILLVGVPPSTPFAPHDLFGVRIAHTTVGAYKGDAKLYPLSHAHVGGWYSKFSQL